MKRAKHKITFLKPEYIIAYNCWKATGLFQIAAHFPIKVTGKNMKSGPTGKEVSSVRRAIEDKILEVMRGVVRNGFA